MPSSTMALVHDDEELSISLSTTHLRRFKRAADGGGTSSTSTSEPQYHHQRQRQHHHQHPPHHSQYQSLPPPTVMASSASSSAGRPMPPVREKMRTEQRIGAYNIIKTLGEGSFGKVKLAVHRSTGQQVALKIIARKKLISRDMQGRVEREIEYLQLLRHPHIIKLYTVIKTPVEIIMVLEYAGGELFDYIVQHGKMEEDEARRFFQQMLCAVEYCHRHKIVHRDLKPENLLLDESLNVKIADFGLSNIMTDGNFLKTSCGSPNYAAPEVIGGKLYAGPEVDVWSCGVILYVLLVGRLPFDDEHIPSLFAKIARGSYIVPPWMSPGAASLIRKMLVVNPVQRVTIDEIRQDLWFLQDLPTYLLPPVEEFFNTGVEPNKSIKVSDIAPNAPPQEQAKLHSEVTDKISKTMGYGKKDVEEALEAEEPSAIKDAYMIVRENKLMQNNLSVNSPKSPSVPEFASPSTHPNRKQAKLGSDNPYFPQSPPDNADGIARIAERMASMTTTDDPNISPMLDSNMSSARSVASTSTATSSRPYASKIGILPSSLPTYHRVFMEREKAKSDGRHVVPDTALAMPDSSAPQPRTPADQEEMVRRLKPHARGSQLRLDETSKRPQGLTPVNPLKRNKPVRWQFGIRSRNSPWEALLCIYKGLVKLEATWIVDEDYEKVHRQDDDDDDDNRDSENEADSSRGGGLPAHDPTRMYKLPADPWFIKTRWTTDKLRKHSVESGLGEPGKRVSLRHGDAAEFVAMRMDIQLYEMDSGVYLVDFKVDGYETPDGRLLEDKEVTSPFPFLDLAARLIMQLADAD